MEQNANLNVFSTEISHSNESVRLFVPLLYMLPRDSWMPFFIIGDNWKVCQPHFLPFRQSENLSSLRSVHNQGVIRRTLGCYPENLRKSSCKREGARFHLSEADPLCQGYHRCVSLVGDSVSRQLVRNIVSR